MLFGVIALGLVVVGIVVVRSLRTTTTEIDASEAVERLEEVLEDDAVDVPTTTAEVATTVVNEAAEEAEVEVVEDDGETAPVTDDDEGEDANADEPAVEEYERGEGALGLPAVGVYPISVSGGEALDLATGASRDYPPDGFVTVTPTDCGVDVRTDFVVERWQSLELCETDAGIELGTEQIFHRFFGLDDLLVRTCTESPMSVEATSWTCTSDTSVAERAVVATVATEMVAGEARDVVVFSTTLRVGDHPDNVETIELWIDIATGLPVREARTYDFTLDTPLGDAGYTEAYEWSMTSLDPVE